MKYYELTLQLVGYATALLDGGNKDMLSLIVKLDNIEYFYNAARWCEINK